jgi:MFS family permease
MDLVHERGSRPAVFYGWWIVVAAFLNLFFSVGVIYYGFPVFYPSLVSALGISRSQVTQGFLLGFLLVGLPAGLAAGTLIDRFGARRVILSGIGLIGLPLLLMGFIHRFWQYEALCMVEVLGYALAGPIANQVLIARWFLRQRGRAMGYAYLGLGLGGVVAPPVADWLIRHLGWRAAVECIGTLILAVLFPVGLGVTRSDPSELGLLPDGIAFGTRPDQDAVSQFRVAAAIRTLNFWFLLVGSTLVMGSINTVIQHFILFLKDQGYTATSAAHFSSALLASSLIGRVLVGYIADWFPKKNTMSFFYLLLGSSIPLLFLVHHPVAALSFALAFGVAMGADYMLIPLVTAECFGVQALGKLVALIVMGYSFGQWVAPWTAGRVFDSTHNYKLVWIIAAAAAAAGACIIYLIQPRRTTHSLRNS